MTMPALPPESIVKEIVDLDHKAMSAVSFKCRSPLNKLIKIDQKMRRSAYIVHIFLACARPATGAKTGLFAGGPSGALLGAQLELKRLFRRPSSPAGRSCERRQLDRNSHAIAVSIDLQLYRLPELLTIEQPI